MIVCWAGPGRLPVRGIPVDRVLACLKASQREPKTQTISGNHSLGRSMSQQNRGAVPTFWPLTLFLCIVDCCFRWRPVARSPQKKDIGASHIGFRCARNASQKLSYSK